MPIDLKDKNKKITDFTIRIIGSKASKKDQNPTRSALKRPISLNNPSTSEKGSKQLTTDESSIMMGDTTQDNVTTKQIEDPIQSVEKNAILQTAPGPLINEFQLLRESVNTVHTDYADLKQTISKQKNDFKQELVDKIDNNTKHSHSIAQENKTLKKENDMLKT